MSWIDTLDRLITDSWMASRDESAAMLDSLLALSLAERWGLFETRDTRLMFLSDTDYGVLFHSLNAHALMADAADRSATPVTEEATAVLPAEAVPEDSPHDGTEGHTGSDVYDAHAHAHAGYAAADADAMPVVRSGWHGRRGLRWLILAVTGVIALMVVGAVVAVMVLTLLPGNNSSVRTEALAAKLDEVESDQVRFARRLVQVDTQLTELATMVDDRFGTTMRAVKLSAAVDQLQTVVDRGQPFTTELERLAPAANGNAALTVVMTRLDGYAAAGVPTLATLRDRFDEMAPRLSQSEPGLFTWLGSGFGLFESTETRRFHGVLAGIGAALRLGNLSVATQQLRDLHLYPAETVDQWLAAAQVRLDADTAIGAVRQAILSNPSVTPEK
jgi:hypothetical protein